MVCYLTSCNFAGFLKNTTYIKMRSIPKGEAHSSYCYLKISVYHNNIIFKQNKLNYSKFIPFVICISTFVFSVPKVRAGDIGGESKTVDDYFAVNLAGEEVTII